MADMGSRRVVLGAGPAQLGLIKRAKARALHVSVVGGMETEPGLALADTALVLDLRNVEALLAFAKDNQVDAVVTAGTDVPVPALGRIVAELGLPGPSLAATRLCSDKVAMKARFHERGVPCARSLVVTTPVEAEHALTALGLPAFLKIADGAGSLGLTRLDAAADLPAAWQYASKTSRASAFLVEACLHGPEAGVTGLVWNGAMRWCLSYNGTTCVGPHPTPIGHSLPFQYPDLACRIEALMCQVVEALGID